MKRSFATILCGAAMACASASTPPPELVAAREAYTHANGSGGATLVQADIHKAENALKEAEESFKNAPEAERTRDLAYVAQRKSELAEALGNTAKAKQDQADAEKAIAQVQVDSTQKKEEELKDLRKQLAEAQNQARDALSQLKGLKDSVKQEDRGLVITLQGSVLFPSNKADLLPAARQRLSEIAKVLQKTKGQTIAIEGYTDSSGPSKRNEELSQHRAEAVMSYLVQQGLPHDRIRAVGRGAENPIADNKTNEGRATNRRVEIVVQPEQSQQEQKG